MLSDYLALRFPHCLFCDRAYEPQETLKNKQLHCVYKPLATGLLLFIFTLFSFPAFAADATLGWDPNNETDVEGYGVYFNQDDTGPPFNLFGYVALNELNDPANPTFTITGLEKGSRYYFAVTAYDTAGNESGFSDSVCADVGDVIAPCASVDSGGSSGDGTSAGGGTSGGGGGSGGGGCFIGSSSNNHARFDRGFPLLTALTCMGSLLWIGRMCFKRSLAASKCTKPDEESAR